MKVYRKNKGLTLLSALVSLVLMGILLAVIYYFLKDYQGNVFKYAAVIAAVLFVLMFVPGLKEQVTVVEYCVYVAFETSRPDDETILISVIKRPEGI